MERALFGSGPKAPFAAGAAWRIEAFAPFRGRLDKLIVRGVDLTVLRAFYGTQDLLHGYSEPALRVLHSKFYEIAYPPIVHPAIPLVVEVRNNSKEHAHAFAGAFCWVQEGSRNV